MINQQLLDFAARNPPPQSWYDRDEFQIRAPHFNANIVFENGICVEAAPILSWTVGKTKDFLLEYFTKKNWKMTPC